MDLLWLQRRHKGSYGPAIAAGDALFPPPTTPIPRLYCTGDSTFPGGQLALVKDTSLP